MGLKDTIKTAVDSAFSAMDDLRTTITFKRVVESYSATTGSVTNTATTYTITDAIKVRYKQNETQNSTVLPTDSKLIFKQADLAITPDLTDLITISSVDHQIVQIKEDPSNTIWIMQLRKP